MNDKASSTHPAGPEGLAASLVATLQEEHDSLVRLRTHFDDHIIALRNREKDGIDEATHRTNDEINVLAKLKHQRDRKMRLLGRVLQIEAGDSTIETVAVRLDTSHAPTDAAAEIRRLRREIRAEAAKTQKRCRDLEFALEFAVHLGRDLLHVLQGMTPAGSNKVYTPKGGAIDSSGTSSFVNKIG